MCSIRKPPQLPPLQPKATVCTLHLPDTVPPHQQYVPKGSTWAQGAHEWRVAHIICCPYTSYLRSLLAVRWSSTPWKSSTSGPTVFYKRSRKMVSSPFSSIIGNGRKFNWIQTWTSEPFTNSTLRPPTCPPATPLPHHKQKTIRSSRPYHKGKRSIGWFPTSAWIAPLSSSATPCYGGKWSRCCCSTLMLCRSVASGRPIWSPMPSGSNQGLLQSKWSTIHSTWSWTSHSRNRSTSWSVNASWKKHIFCSLSGWCQPLQKLRTRRNRNRNIFYQIERNLFVVPNENCRWRRLRGKVTASSLSRGEETGLSFLEEEKLVWVSQGEETGYSFLKEKKLVWVFSRISI